MPTASSRQSELAILGHKRSNFDELQRNEATSRAGKGWEAEEEEKLLSMRAEKSSYDEIK